MSEPRRVPRIGLPPAERPSRAWLLVSLAFHAVLIWTLAGHAVATLGDRQTAGDPSRAGRGGGGGGGQRVTEIELPPYERPGVERVAVAPPPVRPEPQPPPVPEPEVAVAPPEPPEPEPTPVAVGPAPGAGTGSGDGPGQGSGQGGGVGSGEGTGVGSGRGPGTGGEAGEIFPPRARYSILPPLPQPESVRGRSFAVRFWVDAAGRVRKVEVEPPIKDGSYREKFLALMYEYTFEPARRSDGTRVDGEAVITITL